MIRNDNPIQKPVLTSNESFKVSPPQNQPPLEDKKTVTFEKEGVQDKSSQPPPLLNLDEVQEDLALVSPKQSQKIAQELNATPIKQLSKEEIQTIQMRDIEREVKAQDFTLGKLVKDNFGDIEKKLRSTFFKNQKTIDGIYAEATKLGKQLIVSSEDKKNLLEKLKTTPQSQMKDQIARALGLLREDKYGKHAAYYALSENKKALVDAIYKGMMSATFEPTGQLQIPEDTEVMVKTDLDIAYTGQGKHEQQFEKTDKPLFNGPISLKDIKQGNLGDCYVLAAIYSVAEKDPQNIYNMMKDNGDTITVRLFSKNENGDLEPKFYTFPKSTRVGEARAEDSELWVQMLEKAYSIHTNRSYSNMQGGSASEVLKHLLGKNAESLTLPLITARVNRIHDMARSLPAYTLTDKALQTLAEKYQLTETQIEQLKNANDGELSAIKMNIKSMWKWESLKNNQDQLNAFAKDLLELCDNRNRKKPMVSLLENSPTAKNMKGHTFNTQQDVEKVISELRTYAQTHPTITHEAITLDTSTLIDILEGVYIKQKDSFKLTESYEQLQLDTFDKIKNTLSEGRYMALGSRQDIGTPQGTGHSGGESKVDGLAGKHEYALLDAVEINGKKFVRVANPWGNEFARSYDLVNGQLVMKQFDENEMSYLPKGENKKGGGIAINESWVELNDLFFTFGSLHSTEK